MPSMQVCASRYFVDPLGQITHTLRPLSRSVLASIQTRGSAGTGKFSTSINTLELLPIFHHTSTSSCSMLVRKPQSPVAPQSCDPGEQYRFCHLLAPHAG